MLQKKFSALTRFSMFDHLVYDRESDYNIRNVTFVCCFPDEPHAEGGFLGAQIKGAQVNIKLLSEILATFS